MEENEKLKRLIKDQEELTVKIREDQRLKDELMFNKSISRIEFKSGESNLEGEIIRGNKNHNNLTDTLILDDSSIMRNPSIIINGR